MKSYFLRCALGILVLLQAALVQAEDIDLFTGASGASSIPNVLIIVDNTANWTTPFTNEIAALSNTISALPVGKFNVGLMMFTETGSGDSGNDGAYVRSAIRPLDAAYKTKLVNLINGFDVSADKGNGGKAALSLLEAYRYFSGGAPYAGNNKNKADYSGNTFSFKVGSNDISAASKAIWGTTGNALASKADTSYEALPASGCASKTYIIYVSNGPAQDSATDITTAVNALTALGGNTTAIPLSPSGSQGNPADEWARFMHNSDLQTSVYTIDVDKVTSGQGPGWTALLKSMAGVSSGKYFDVVSSGTQIATALGSIFTEIQAVNSVFASVSLPVSVNTQGTYLNQVFVGMFRPDSDGYPRWDGNLKQYKLGYNNGNLGLLDADNADAINTQTGFIAECARSFWTPTSVDSYWSFQPNGKCLTVSNSAQSNYPDGNIVEKGAQAHVLRNSTLASRNVKTCSPTFASCTSLTNFDTSNTAITDTLLGADATYSRTELINWARGVDTVDQNANGNTTTEFRPSVHGDVVHSRPVAINFGTDASPQVVVFYGANDGMLRAVNGNRTAAIGTAAAGSELWSFMPPEFYSNIKRLRANTTQISYPGVTGGAAKPYGIDGPITSVTSGSSTWLYAGMRRGGRALYAFDVTTPASPTLKWKIGCPNLANDTGCTSGFDQLGQTWSGAVSLKASGYDSGSKPMLMFGGGYDSCEDADTNSTSVCSSPKGNRIYVVDADAGTRLATLNTDRGVVGDVVVAKGSDGLAKYAYAADLGGNVYRITIGTAAPASWTITKVASVGCSTVTTCAPRRKFMFAPDVVEENGIYTVLLGSGDREKPTSSSTNAAAVSNYFFMIKDKPSDASWLSSESGNCGGTGVICLNSLLAITTNTNPSSADLATKKGWYLGLASSEQVVTTAITVLGTVTFSTSRPSSVAVDSCSANLGTARVYNIAYTNAATKNGTANRYETLPAGGLSPSPVAGKVTLDDGKTVIFVIGGSAASALQTKQPPTFSSGGAQPSKRVYWNVQK